jgi:hypothetical protein
MDRQVSLRSILMQSVLVLVLVRAPARAPVPALTWWYR